MVLLATVTVASAASAAIDPFYEALDRRGTEAFNRRDFQTAAKLLRRASFGMLDEPEQLADCLTRLALAQAAANDRAGFRATFDRIAEVETRFDAWSSAVIPEQVRAAFRRQAARLIPAATREASFLSHGTATRDDELEALPPARRRAELERRIEREPRAVRWRLLLARLDLDEGHAEDALHDAEAALVLAPGNTEGLYLRGLALAARGEWDGAVNDLRASGRATREPEGAAALLAALAALERWDEAEGFLAELPAAVAADSRVAAVARRIAAH